MKKWDKKTIMWWLDNIIPDDFKCDGMHITFPNDDTAIIELTNRSDAERKDGDGDEADD